MYNKKYHSPCKNIWNIFRDSHNPNFAEKVVQTFST